MGTRTKAKRSRIEVEGGFELGEAVMGGSSVAALERGDAHGDENSPGRRLFKGAASCHPGHLYGTGEVSCGVRVRGTKVSFWVKVKGEKQTTPVPRNYTRHLDIHVRPRMTREEAEAALAPMAALYVRTFYGVEPTAGRLAMEPPASMPEDRRRMFDDYFAYLGSDELDRGLNRSSDTVRSHQRHIYRVFWPYLLKTGREKEALAGIEHEIISWHRLDPDGIKHFVRRKICKDDGFDPSCRSDLENVDERRVAGAVHRTRAAVYEFWKWIEKKWENYHLPYCPTRPKLPNIPLRPQPFRPTDNGHQHLETREGVWRATQGLGNQVVQYLAIMGYYFDLRPQEIYALTYNDFIVLMDDLLADDLAQLFETKVKTTDGAPVGAFLAVQVHRQQTRPTFQYRGPLPQGVERIRHFDALYEGRKYPPGYRPPKGLRARKAICWDRRAAEWVRAFLEQELAKGGDPYALVLNERNNDRLCRYWAAWGLKNKSGKQPIQLKDARRLSAWWLGHKTDIDIRILMKQLGHTKEETTRLYMRDGKGLETRADGELSHWEKIARAARAAKAEDSAARQGERRGSAVPRLRHRAAALAAGLGAAAAIIEPDDAYAEGASADEGREEEDQDDFGEESDADEELLLDGDDFQDEGDHP